jgi:hypothetical protein
MHAAPVADWTILGVFSSKNDKCHQLEKKGNLMAYYTDRFQAAVQCLVNEGSVKLRLTRAYSEFLETLQDEDAPISVKNSLSELHDAMHRVAPMGTETSVRASVQKMSTLEAGRHAESIVQIYAQLLTQGERNEPLKVVEEADKPPWYLVSGT